MFLSDDEMLVNPHIYGAPGPETPVLHLRRTPGAHMVSTYLDAFERIWKEAHTLAS